MAEPTMKDVEALGIPLSQLLCIGRAAIAFGICEATGGPDCVKKLVDTIRACRA
jgi:hypothetical protein